MIGPSDPAFLRDSTFTRLFAVKVGCCEYLQYVWYCRNNATKDPHDKGK